MKKKEVLFHQGNALVHKNDDKKTPITLASLLNVDLAASYFHLLADLKKMLSGKRFR